MCNTPDDFILAEGEVELRALFFLYHTSVLLSIFLSLSLTFKLKHTEAQNDHHTHLSKSPIPVSYFDSGPLQLPALTFYLISPSFSHTQPCTQKHTQPLPTACIYLFVIFPNSVWRMSDSLTLHSARLIERHNIYVAETANYPTIYHPDYLSDWKLLVHVIGIIWN